MKRHYVQRRVYLFSMGILALLALLVIITLTIPGIRARAVMSVSSWQRYEKSPLNEKGIKLELPAGEGWFDSMLFYHDSKGLKTTGGNPLELSIYYTFGAFDRDRSLVYTPGSGYYSSFYGAYLITGPSLPEADAAWIRRIAAYDYETLILKALGHPSPYGTFKVDAVEIREESELLGYPDWLCYEVDIQAPGVAHERDDFRLHYWQFGTPPDLGSAVAYGPVALRGRVYVKTFEGEQLMVMVYLICESSEVLERADARIQAQGRLVIRK